MAKRSGDVYIPRCVSVPALDKDTLWEFQPKKIGNQRAFYFSRLETIVMAFVYIRELERLDAS